MRLWICLIALAAVVGCDKKSSPPSPHAKAPKWTAQLSDVQTTGHDKVEVEADGAKTFRRVKPGDAIAAGSVVRTPADVRATVASAGLTLTLNHSTVAKVAASGLELRKGEAVVAATGDPKAEVHIELPHGAVVLRGAGKVAVVAGKLDSTVSVASGVVGLQHGKQSFEARTGQEIVLRKSGTPEVTAATDLGREVGWADMARSASKDALPEVPRGLGKLVGKTPGRENEHRLDLQKHAVTVKIRGSLAYTEITETFRNPTSQTLEGVYRFPLPSDARISRLALKVGNKVTEGEFVETGRAERIFKDVIEKWRDPAMLKWKEGNTFELRIFPITPHQKRQVTIGYVERLQPVAGGYRYTYPMPVDVAGLIPAGEFTFDASLMDHDPTQPLEVSGYAAKVTNGATKSDKALTHVRYDENHFIARGDLSIRFGRKDAKGLRGYSYAGKTTKQYAVFVVRPDLPAREQIRPRDFVFVVDRSTNQHGAAIRVQKKIVDRMIREMDPLDRVSVIACSERCDHVGPVGFSPARQATADKVALAMVDVKASGATYPVEAVRVAAEIFRHRKKANREAHVVYFTDGIASAGELRPGPLGDAVKRALGPFDARLSVVNVGGNGDDANLEAIARGGRGTVTRLDPMLSVTGQALSILAAHYHTVLDQPRIEAPTALQVDATLPPALVAGDEIVFAGRFERPVTGKVTLAGLVDGKPWSAQYPVNMQGFRDSKDTFVPAEWAAQRIRELELDPTDDHRKEIIKLSTRYGVLSRYTTLLALENRQMQEEYGVHRRQRTQWTGGQNEEEDDTASAEETPAPPPRPTVPQHHVRHASRRKAAPMLASGAAAPARPSSTRSGKATTKGLTANDVANLFDDGGPSFGRTHPIADPVGHPRRRYHRDYHRAPYHIEISGPKLTTSWERSNEEKRGAQWKKDRTNRSKRMRYIRAMVRAGHIERARLQTTDWLETNPMDPEAIVQLAQTEARLGNLDVFWPMLISAADAAPRGRWLQERIHFAAKAQNDEAMECAFRVALEATAKHPPKKPSDILACPMVTHVAEWFEHSGPRPVLPPAVKKQPSGRVRVSLHSNNGADWDLALVEPSGRLLWWGSARQHLKFANVVGGDRTEYLSLPRTRSGTYSVYVIPREARPNDRLHVEVRVLNQKKSFDVVAKQPLPMEVAEFSYQGYHGYRYR